EDPVAREELAAVQAERIRVATQEAVEGFEDRQAGLALRLTRDQRRILEDPRPAADPPRHLVEDLHVRAAARLGGDPLEALARAPRHGAKYVLLGDPGVPELEVAHPRVFSHALAVSPDHTPCGGFAIGLVEAEKAPAYDGARDQPLDVPFPRSRQRLVEV